MRRIFAALSINITCSFSALIRADVNKTGGSILNAHNPPKWVTFACRFTTLHAASPESALSRLALMVMQADTGLTYSEILEYCRSMIDVIIQFRKTGDQRRPTAVRVLRGR
ncbi:MAG: hypothetical protein GKR97_20910 [Rhizobiaceae bacterium]|nr:hypothetical protein [Rhizobiaceae bacterium]